MSAALNMNSTIGQVLGHPRASVVYLNSGSVNRFSFSVTVRNVMALPGYVYVSGTTSSSGVYSVSVSAVAGPWKDKTNLGVCRARYRAGGTFRGIMTGSASALTVSVDADLGVRAGCGELRVRIDVRVSFDYVRPNDFSLRVRLVLKFGGLGWKPTVYRS